MAYGMRDVLSDKIAFGPDCWHWPASKSKAGYGRFAGTFAHRAVYEALVGPIPKGLEIHHKCNVRDCVNPDHLELVTHRENLLLGDTFSSRQAAQTHCIRGHEFNEENTRLRNGHRTCRACDRIYQLNKYHQKKKKKGSG